MPEATEVDDAGGVQGPANTFWQWQHPLTATVSQLSAGHTVIHMEAAAAVRVSFICSIMFTAAAEELKALSPVGLSTPLAWLAAWWCAVCYMVRLLLLCPAAAGALWLHSALQEWELYAGSCQHLSQWVSGLQSSSTLLDISIGVSHAEDPWKTGKVGVIAQQPGWRARCSSPINVYYCPSTALWWYRHSVPAASTETASVTASLPTTVFQRR